MKLNKNFLIYFICFIFSLNFVVGQDLIENEINIIVSNNLSIVKVKSNTIFYNSDKLNIDEKTILSSEDVNFTLKNNSPKAIIYSRLIPLKHQESLKKISYKKEITKKIKTKVLTMPFQQYNQNGLRLVSVLFEIFYKTHIKINKPLISLLNYNIFFIKVDKKIIFKNTTDYNSQAFCFSAFSRPPPII